MLAFLQLIIRRSLRNLPLTIAVLLGLLVLVTLLVAAPLYTSALADVGLRATLADAPLDQRSVRIVLPVERLDRAEAQQFNRQLQQAGSPAAWLAPQLLRAVRSKRLLLPGADTTRRVALVEADTALENLRVVEGRLPQAIPNGVEVVLGVEAAAQFDVTLGDTLPLSERSDGTALVSITVVGLVEPADLQSTFWQSGVVALEPVVQATQSEATLLVAPNVVWERVISLLPPTRASGELRWRIVFDTTVVNGTNATQAESAVAAVIAAAQQALPRAEVKSDFGGIVAGYRERLSIARVPLLLLLSEMAGLALMYIAWTAAFQAETSAAEQAVMGARGAGVGQILAVSSGQALLLTLGAALSGIPLALLLLRASVLIGPVAELARSQGLRLQTTPDAPQYVLGAAIIGLLALALPAIPAARQSIVALRQGAARPAELPFWQRTYLDVLVMVVATVAFVQFRQQGGVLQQFRGRFQIDPFLLLAPLLVLIAGALLFLRLYPHLLNLTRGLTVRLRGLPLALCLVQLTRNRAASTRLVLLLSLAVALGLFAQTFGATVALNQRQRAGYTVGATGRATLINNEPLLAGALPSGVTGSWALRDTIRPAGSRTTPGTLLAVDPATLESVAFNPPERPLIPLTAALAALGPTPAPDGIALPGTPRTLSLYVDRAGAPFRPALLLSDSAGRFLRVRMTQIGDAASPTYEATLDVAAAAYPLRLTAIALLATNEQPWLPAAPGERAPQSRAPRTVTVGQLGVDRTPLALWGGDIAWQPASDTSLAPEQEAAGLVELDAVANGQQAVVITQGRAMRAVLLRPNAQPVEPVGVIVNEPFLDANNLRLGDTTLFSFRNRPVQLRIAGVMPRFPSLGIDQAPFVLAHGPRLLRFLNRSYAQPVTPNELWLDFNDTPQNVDSIRATRGIGTLLLNSTVLRSFGRDPLAVGIAGVFFLGFVTSIGLAALGFAIATYLAGRRRRLEFAVLQAIGLDRRAVLATLALEQAVLVTLALIAGTLLGVVLSQLILPFLAISDRGRVAVPPYSIVVPWGTLAQTYAGLIALFAAATLLVLWLLLQRGVGSALRIGEE